MNIKIFKSDGTKNNFILIVDNDNHNLIKKNIVRICRQFQTDGLIIISDHEKYDYKMDYYNNDASWETMCANGARCAGLLMYKLNRCGKKINFISGDGTHFLTVNDKLLSLSIRQPIFKSKEINILNYIGRYVDSGAKHFAIITENLNAKNIKKIGREIRQHKFFEPDGVNVNFMEILNQNHIYVTTYEKGIENTVMSCGTGSVACAYYAHHKNLIKSPIKISVPGGKLQLIFNKDWSEVWLSGPAKISEPIIIEI
tara:strand:+ start:472 stop:1239 length:768 start_codon:yes stop_codon:yes gene_type:complete